MTRGQRSKERAKLQQWQLVLGSTSGDRSSPPQMRQRLPFSSILRLSVGIALCVSDTATAQQAGQVQAMPPQNGSFSHHSFESAELAKKVEWLPINRSYERQEIQVIKVALADILADKTRFCLEPRAGLGIRMDRSQVGSAAFNMDGNLLELGRYVDASFDSSWQQAEDVKSMPLNSIADQKNISKVNATQCLQGRFLPGRALIIGRYAHIFFENQCSTGYFDRVLRRIGRKWTIIGRRGVVAPEHNEFPKICKPFSS